MEFRSIFRKASFFVLPVLGAVLLASCQSGRKWGEVPPGWEVPLTLQTFPKEYADRAIEVADTNKDGTITMVEWTNAGGDQRSFLLADQNKDGVVTRAELVRIGSNAHFFDFTRRYADFNKDNQLTPREFRSASGINVLRIETR
jgi:EF hand